MPTIIEAIIATIIATTIATINPMRDDTHGGLRIVFLLRACADREH
jgi:hypothetical protein